MGCVIISFSKIGGHVVNTVQGKICHNQNFLFQFQSSSDSHRWRWYIVNAAWLQFQRFPKLTNSNYWHLLAAVSLPFDRLTLASLERIHIRCLHNPMFNRRNFPRNATSSTKVNWTTDRVVVLVVSVPTFSSRLSSVSSRSSYQQNCRRAIATFDRQFNSLMQCSFTVLPCAHVAVHGTLNNSFRYPSLYRNVEQEPRTSYKYERRYRISVRESPFPVPFATYVHSFVHQLK